MKFRLIGTERELVDKGPSLLKALANRLNLNLEELSEDTLQKSESSLVTSRHKPIQDLIDQATDVYNEEIAAMMIEIDEVLNAAISHS